MHPNPATDLEGKPLPRHIGTDGDFGGGDAARPIRARVVSATSLRAAIEQLRALTQSSVNRPSQALAANLVLLRAHGVDDEILDLVVELVLAQNADEEMAAAVNYLASGFLLALLTFEEERAVPPDRQLGPD
jgi:hypothetical protein